MIRSAFGNKLVGESIGFSDRRGLGGDYVDYLYRLQRSGNYRHAVACFGKLLYYREF